MNEIAHDAAFLLEAAERKQRLAADPKVSAWVRANAGTGKTHVLVQRILRLLLSGASPRSILCLTFTKNAAAEMEARVLAKLGAWAIAGPDSLLEQLKSLLGRPPSGPELELARTLFASVIDAPGGLSIMTIHSFCERILRRYSLEADVSPGFSILTEEEANAALREASRMAFGLAAGGSLEEALETLVAYAAEDEFGRILQAMLCERAALGHLFKLSDLDPVAHATARLQAKFGLAPGDTKESLLRFSSELLQPHLLREVVSALSGGTPSDREGAKRFHAALGAGSDEMRFEALRAALLTKEGSPRKSLMTSQIRKRFEALESKLVDAQVAFAVLCEKLGAVKIVDATSALLRLSAAIFDFYEKEKQARGALDFDDLIEKTLSLLSRDGAAEWVLYQLDSRIDHILVDEAQDTSPSQWAILEKLTSDFFAGQGARETVPTIFAVGDEKQSIYGFQGAVPELLVKNGKAYAEKVRGALLEWRDVDLNLSFRTLSPILEAADAVCANVAGLRETSPVPHLAFRGGSAGFVEIWEPEKGEPQSKESVWDIATEEEPAPKPAEALARRIAEQIKHWLDKNVILESKNRPIAPGDILILLRKREPMAALLQGALKQLGIPVAGADRVALLDTLAVMDMLALVDALLLPEDDLALASVLKSPLFGFSEEELFDIAYGRQTSLMRALQGPPGRCEKYAETVSRLRNLQARALRDTPSEFFGHVLIAEGGRAAFAARFGSQCYDALNELLDLADNFGPATLSEFIAFLRASASEVKRETDQAAREVRIMTVHGAKGLESEIVILADCCSNGAATPAPIFFLDDGSRRPPLPAWAVKGTAGLPLVAAAKEARKAAEERESARLLYVAMTRARDRLYVAGFHGGTNVPEGCWYDSIRASLADRLEEGADFAGRSVWRFGSCQEELYSAPAEVREGTDDLPAWVTLPPPKEPEAKIISPSRLLPWIGPSKEAESAIPRETARAVGSLVHRLLEVLPFIEPPFRSRAARLIACTFSAKLSPKQRDAGIDTVLSLLSNSEVSVYFREGLAEAGLAFFAADRPSRNDVIVLGQADRILLGGANITVLDYKSSTAADGDDIPDMYIAQLAAYRLALQRLYRGQPVNAALLNTGSGAFTRLDARTLDEIAARLDLTLCPAP